MNRNFHNLRGSPANPAPRWRNVFIALVLALVIGSAGQTPTAQAAPAGATELKFFMLANKERPGQICMGELVHINVLVYRYKLVGGVSGAPDTITGVTVDGWSNNPNIGQISPRKNTTTWASSIHPGAADFVFHAENPGDTTVTFDATVATPSWFGSNWGGGSKTVTTSVDVQVIPCQFKVKVVLGFNPGIYNITVISDDALMIRDETGTFTGNSTMHWVYSNFSIPCSVGASDSSVDLTGSLDDGDQFVGTMTFQPTTVTGCGGSEQGIVNPLEFSVASSGGVSTSTATAPPLPGPARIVVVPEEGQAVSFIPGDHELRVGPALLWSAMLWDNFSSLLGALLALR